MCSSTILSRCDVYRDNTGLVKYKDFIRMDRLFKHGFIRVRKYKKPEKSIYIRCPKCGRIGRLIVVGRRAWGHRVYAIKHRDNRTANGESRCIVSLTHEFYEKVDEIYHRYRLKGVLR